MKCGSITVGGESGENGDGFGISTEAWLVLGALAIAGWALRD